MMTAATMGATVTAKKPQDLPAARRRLDYAISELIEPKPETVTRDDGTHTITWLDSLYDQLVAAVDAQKSSGWTQVGGNTTPIWPAALDLLNKISDTVKKWWPEWPHPDPINPIPPAVLRLQLLAEKTWTVEDAQHVHNIATKLDGFAAEIREKLAPEPTIYLMAPGDQKGAAACTACGTDYVWRKDPGDNNRPVRQPALKVTKDGCACQECGAAWEPGALRLLAAALGYPLADGVLE